jgi:redox-sensitive bicupin YhaK (pirin superfamily)
MIELVIDARRRDLGGFEVGRVLPYAKHRSVGPFVFLDHLGPVDFPAGIGRQVDVRPHPPNGLSTLTYQFSGEIMHRDSVGSAQPVRPGEVNWMTAGSGITHSERFERARAEGDHLHGLQAWVALPREHEETAPRFEHHAAASIPKVTRDGASLEIVAGTAYGARSPVGVRPLKWPVPPLFVRTRQIER